MENLLSNLAIFFIAIEKKAINLSNKNKEFILFATTIYGFDKFRYLFGYLFNKSSSLVLYISML